jgi:hypothetical protein
VNNENTSLMGWRFFAIGMGIGIPATMFVPSMIKETFVIPQTRNLPKYSF